MKGWALAGVLAVMATGWLSGEENNGAAKERAPVVSAQARRLHEEGYVFDGHNDLPWMLRDRGDRSFHKIDLRRPQKGMHTDIPRLRRGNVGAQFWSAYVPAETAQAGKAVRDTLEQIDIIHRLVETYPDIFAMASTADDVERIRKTGRIASLIGVEGGHSIDNSLGVLRTFYRLGVRYLTLTHSATIDWADSATDKPRHGGLTKVGEAVVAEMNRLGMLVDISHVSVATMKHALRVSRAPVIASHSSAFALADHPRNVPDDVLRLVAKNGGVVMVNFYSGFITPEGARVSRVLSAEYDRLKKQYPDEKPFDLAWKEVKDRHPFSSGSVATVVDHIDHIVKVAGIDHVGLGSDFDGVSRLPKGLEDVSCYPAITQELLDRGYEKKKIHQILYRNTLRVLRAAEQVASGEKGR